MFDLPIEYALVQFKGDKFSGEIVPALPDLAQFLQELAVEDGE